MTTYRIRIDYDDSPSSPREDDNLGTMVCWHRRYTLGDEQPKCAPHEYKAGLAREYDDTIPEDLELTRDDELREARENVRHAIIQVREHAGFYAYERFGEDWEEYRRCTSPSYRTPEERVATVLKDKYVILPLYLYDHSGITISAVPFSCPWDSGQIGFIYVSERMYNKTMMRPAGTPMTAEDTARATRALLAEVKEYDQYLTGDVYGFTIERAVPYEKHRADGETICGVDWDHDHSCWGFYGHDIHRNGILDSIPSFLHAAAKDAMSAPGKWFETEAPAEAAA